MTGRKSPIAGRVAVLTGAAGGIGSATARTLVERGVRVALLDRDAAGIEALAAELGPATAPFAVDVTDRDALDAVMTQVVEHFGRLDIVVANAGISGPLATVASIDPDAFDRVVEINLLGAWRTVRAALPHVIPRRGHIVLTCSLVVAIPGATVAAYSASKAGVEAFGRALGVELAATGTTVGIAYFGAVNTPLVQDLVTNTALADGLERLPHVIGAPISPNRAANAMVNGIQRRARTMHAPWWVPALLAARAQLALTDPLAARLPPLVRLIATANRPPED